MRWRPISTAPKDQLILLAQPPFNPAEHKWVVMQGRWIDVPHTSDVVKWLMELKKTELVIRPQWLGMYPGIMLHGHRAYDGKSYEGRPLVIYPTHWMPLPEPPTGRFKHPSIK